MNGMGQALLGLYRSKAAPLALVAAGLALASFFAAHETDDVIYFFKPWMAAIRAGGVHALSGSFSDYSPPYLYLMWLVGPLVPALGATLAIKLLNIPFIALASWAAGSIVRFVTGSPERARWAAASLWIVPTLLVNGFFWGQCDVVYTSILLVSAYAAMRGLPWVTCIAFGIALSFKFQSIFLAPFLACLVLTGRIRIRHFAGTACVYVAMMFPAWLEGRPALDLLLIYFRQTGAYQGLSLNAPNLWLFLQRAGLPFELGFKLALALSAASGLGFPLWMASRRIEPRTLMLGAALSATLMPFVLPAMHERYFFVADIFLVVVAWISPRLALAAVLCQLASLAAYGGYLGVKAYLSLPISTVIVSVPVMTVLVGWLMFETARLPPRMQDEGRLRILL